MRRRRTSIRPSAAPRAAAGTSRRRSDSRGGRRIRTGPTAVGRRVPRGAAAEALVCARLREGSWEILGERLRVGPLEIDILARRGEVVAIIEVRGRRVGAWVEPLDSVSPAKRDRLKRAARALWAARFADDPTVRVLRIDVAAVTWRPDGHASIEVVEGAVE